MSKLGVTVPLFHATPCEDHCSGKEGLTIEDTLDLIKDLGNATAFADMAAFDDQQRRRDEIIKQTTPQKVFTLTSTEPTQFTDPTKVTEVTEVTKVAKISIDSNGGF